MIDIYEKLGNYAMDISKYVITGVVIATFFRSFDEDEYVVYLAGFAVAFAFMVFAFWAYHKHNDIEQYKNKKGGKK